MKKILFILILLMFGCLLQSKAQGDLLVTPRRVVFEGNKQKEELSLVNIGKDTAVFSISFVQRRMKEDGSFENITTPDSGQMFADSYLRVFPRKVVLAPGEPQLIALQCRRTSDMAAGEYRSHLYFRAEKNNAPLGMEGGSGDTALLSVQLIPVFGISIPIIIRVGDVAATTSLSDIAVETKQDTLSYLKLAINRTGNASVYGDLFVDFIPTQGKPYEIGCVKGIGVYTNINKRTLSLRLKNIPGKPMKNGSLQIRYTSSDDANRIVYSQASYQVN